MKKSLSILLVIAILITTQNFVTAAIQLPGDFSDAQICEILGILKGTGQGVTSTYLKTPAQRYQAATIQLRLLGAEKNIVRLSSKPNFTDISGKSDYIVTLLSFLKNNPQYGWLGYPDGSFKPINNVSSKEFYKILLECLGYKTGVDYTYNDTISFAKSKGLEAIASVTSLKNSDLAIGIVETLKTVPKNGNKPYIAVLVEDLKSIPIENAIGSGLYKPQTPTIQYINTISDKLIEVVLAGADLDQPSISDFKITSIIQSPSIVEVKEAPWSTNYSNILISFDVPQQAFEMYTVIYKDQQKTFMGIDQTVNALPLSVLEVSAKDSETIQVKFSKPILTNDLVIQINSVNNNNALSIRSTTQKSSGYVIELKTEVQSSSSLYEVKITGAIDYIGNQQIDTPSFYVYGK